MSLSGSRPKVVTFLSLDPTGPMRRTTDPFKELATGIPAPGVGVCLIGVEGFGGLSVLPAEDWESKVRFEPFLLPQCVLAEKRLPLVRYRWIGRAIQDRRSPTE